MGRLVTETGTPTKQALPVQHVQHVTVAHTQGLYALGAVGKIRMVLQCEGSEGVCFSQLV